MGNEITIDWVKSQLLQFQNDEITAMETLRIAAAKLETAKAEYANAEEALKGVRGVINEFAWQLKFYEENGRLP